MAVTRDANGNASDQMGGTTINSSANKGAYNMQGDPTMADYMNALYPTMATTASQGFQTEQDANSAGYNALRDSALRTGPSAWALLAKQQTAGQSADAKERAANEIAGQTAQARDSLAAQGGLSSGARERVAEGGVKNFLSMSQDNARQENLADLGTGVTDEQNKLTSINNLSNAEANRTNQWANDRDKLNEYNMNLYQTNMQAVAADKQAQATRDSGKK